MMNAKKFEESVMRKTILIFFLVFSGLTNAMATNITCGSSRAGGVETDTVTTLRGEADITIRNTGEHFSLSEGQQLTIRGGQTQHQQQDLNQEASQWNRQLQNMGGSVDFGDIPGILRNIRENEGTLIRNLRSSLEGATRENSPALLKAVDRAIGVLDEDAMTMNNFMRRVRESSGRPDQGIIGAIADCLRSNASYRTDVGAMLRQLRQIESLNLGEIPGRLESLRSSMANGYNAISEANAAIPDGTAANAPVLMELRQRIAEFQQTLAMAEAEVGRITRQLSDMIAGGQGNVQQARALVRQAVALNDAIAGYRQSLRRISSRAFTTASISIESEQAEIQGLTDQLNTLSEQINGVSEKTASLREAFDSARNAASNPGQSQEVYREAADALNSAISGSMADLLSEISSIRDEIQKITEQKTQFIDRAAEKIAASLTLRNLVNDLNRRISSLSSQLTSISTEMAKFSSEQSTLLRSLNITAIEDSTTVQLQDLEESMADATQAFEAELTAYTGAAYQSNAADRVRSSMRLLNSFQKSRRNYLYCQRLYESITRGLGRGIMTMEQEEIQSIWERISNDYQRLSNSAGILEAELTNLENQLNAFGR